MRERHATFAHTAPAWSTPRTVGVPWIVCVPYGLCAHRFLFGADRLLSHAPADLIRYIHQLEARSTTPDLKAKESVQRCGTIALPAALAAWRFDALLQRYESTLEEMKKALAKSHMDLFKCKNGMKEVSYAISSTTCKFTAHIDMQEHAHHLNTFASKHMYICSRGKSSPRTTMRTLEFVPKLEFRAHQMCHNLVHAEHTSPIVQSINCLAQLLLSSSSRHLANALCISRRLLSATRLQVSLA